jgi:hypothetical protein
LELGYHPSEQSSPGNPVDGRRGALRGDHGWVRAEFEHDDAEEEAGGDVEQERGEQDNYASCDGAPCDVEEGKHQDEGAAEAS